MIAAHPDQALALLADPSAPSGACWAPCVLQNHTVLHTDGSLLPHARGARASWNYLLDACSTSQPDVHVTYHLNRLQALSEPLDYCVTLNQTPASARPRAPPDGLRAPRLHACEPRGARPLPALQGERNTYYCGAYHGWGFHEDGCVSGLRAALALGCAW